jgi:transcriptional antiterminator
MFGTKNGKVARLQQLADLIRNNPGIRVSELAKAMGTTHKQILRDVTDLSDDPDIGPDLYEKDDRLTLSSRAKNRDQRSKS